MVRVNRFGVPYDDCRQKGVAVARQVGTILRAAGLKKTGRYGSPGFDLGESGNGTHERPTAFVFWCGTCDAIARDKVAEMAAAVEADGRFDVSVESRGSTHNTLRITRKVKS